MESTERQGTGQMNTNTVLGALGTAGFAGLNLQNLLGGMNRPPLEPPATRRDLDYERDLTEKDAKIGKLEAQIYTDQQVLASERRLTDKIDVLEDKVTAMNNTQAVLNAKQEGFMANLAQRIASFDAMTARYITPPVIGASEAVWNSLKPATTNANNNNNG